MEVGDHNVRLHEFFYKTKLAESKHGVLKMVRVRFKGDHNEAIEWCKHNVYHHYSEFRGSVGNLNDGTTAYVVFEYSKTANFRFESDALIFALKFGS